MLPFAMVGGYLFYIKWTASWEKQFFKRPLYAKKKNVERVI
jgi:hypothetical protein